MPPFLPDPAAPIFGILQGAIAELLARGDSIFLPAAQTLFFSIAAILVVAEGVKIFYGRDDPLWGMLTVLFPIATMFTVIRYYQDPIPGLGISFSNLITDQAVRWTQALEGHATARMYKHFDDLGAKLPWPNLANIPGILVYAAAQIAVAIAKMMTLGVVAAGLIFHAVAGVLGPIFLPFALVPHLSAFFWRWVTVFVGTAFTSVVAAAYMLVGEKVIAGLTATSWPPVITPELYFRMGMFLVVLSGIHILCVTAIPIFTSQLFGAHVHGPNLSGALMAWRSLARGR